jgi:hypothetical protein
MRISIPGSRHVRRAALLCACGAATCAAALLPAPARASQLIDRNATEVRLQVDASGQALLTYRAAGRLRHVLAWGAINARAPSRARPQARFRLDYSGGWGRYRRLVWRTFRNVCGPYRGPALVWLVTACTAPDGSNWALQAFPQPLPDLGFTPWMPSQRATWLELSHWRGPLPRLQVWRSWVYGGRFQQLFGRFTYLGRPVYGFSSTRYGAPTDGYGRLLYLDTYDSVYGRGWRRENSFLAHQRTGGFCYGFYPFDPVRGGYAHPPGYAGGLRGPGVGTRYRITAQGPGVTPDVVWEGAGFHPFDRRSVADVTYQQRISSVFRQVIGDDSTCHS